MSETADGAISGKGKSALIVHVVRQFWPNRGGLEDVALNLCRQAVRAGYRVRVVTLDSLFQERDKQLPPREILEDIEIVRIPWRGSTRYPVAQGVLAHIADANLVHVHAIDFFFDFLAFTRFIHRKPMIATTHGGFFHTRKFALIKSIWFQTLTRFSASRYTAVVGCSQSDFESFSPIARSRLHLIENGADIDKFRDKASSSISKKLLTIGRFSTNKRLDNLLKTLAELKKLDPLWTLEIIGMNSDLSASDIASKAAELDLTESVTVVTGLDNGQIAERISQSSIFVSASEYEGFGLVAIEALSAGLIPVLQGNSAYTNLARRHDVIRIANFNDPRETARSITDTGDALASQGYEILRKKALAAAHEYSWETVGLRYLELYRLALKA